MANGTIAFDTLQTSGQITSTAKSLDTDFVVSGSAKALCHVSADGATASNTLNISSLDDDGTGDRGINFSSNMGNATYIVTFSSEDGNSGSLNRTCDVSDGTMATGAFDFESVMTSSSSNRTNTDTINFVNVHGDLA